MRSVLLIQLEDGTIQEVPLMTETLTLGRDAACDLVLASPIISRQHARLTRRSQGYTLEDLGSRNGTTVNGHPITTTQVLHDGDQIELGGIWKMSYADADATRAKASAVRDGVWLDVAQQDAYVDGLLISPRLSPAQYALLQLLMSQVGRIYSRQDIIAAVWPNAPAGVSDEAVDALIKRVRQRLSEVPNGAQYLITLRGRGVMLKAPDSRPLAA